jgi:transposase
MLQARAGLRAEFNKLHRMLFQIVRGDAECRRFMTAPGVGAVVAVTYKTAIDGYPPTPESASALSIG